MTAWFWSMIVKVMEGHAQGISSRLSTKMVVCDICSQWPVSERGGQLVRGCDQPRPSLVKSLSNQDFRVRTFANGTGPLVKPLKRKMRRPPWSQERRQKAQADLSLHQQEARHCHWQKLRLRQHWTWMRRHGYVPCRHRRIDPLGWLVWMYLGSWPLLMTMHAPPPKNESSSSTSTTTPRHAFLVDESIFYLSFAKTITIHKKKTNSLNVHERRLLWAS